jgi:hypothetical protein
MNWFEKYIRNFAARQTARDALPRWVKIATLLTNIPSFLGTTFVLFAAILSAHAAVHASPTVGSVRGPAMGATLVSAFLLGIPLGLMLANVVTWLIPPLRRAHERGFADAPGASFSDAMRQLRQFALAVAPIALAAATLAIWDPWL